MSAPMRYRDATRRDGAGGECAADRFAECDKHAGRREEHDRCGKDRIECEKGCDHDHR